MKKCPSVILLAGAVFLTGCQAPQSRQTASVSPQSARSRAALERIATGPEDSTFQHQARAMSVALAPLTGSVPSRTTRPLNGNGGTGSIACEFTGNNRPATKWWVGGPTPPRAAWQYNVSPYPATATTGFEAQVPVTVRFRATAANTTPPPATSVTPIANRTVVLMIRYQ